MMSSSKPKSKIIIGVDPGSRVTGYGIVIIEGTKISPIDFGTIRPPVSRKYTERYRIIFEGIGQLLDQHRPDALSVETQYIGKNAQSGIKLGMARGVIMLAASLREIPIFEYAPARAKKAVVGNGQASKGQVQKMVQHLLALSVLPKPDDAADGLALAICHAHCHRGGVQNV